MNESITRNPVREQAKILSAQDAVTQAYAYYWASAIMDSGDANLIASWQAAYEQSGKRQATLWGFIYSSKYSEMQALQDQIFSQYVTGKAS